MGSLGMENEKKRGENSTLARAKLPIRIKRKEAIKIFFCRPHRCLCVQVAPWCGGRFRWILVPVALGNFVLFLSEGKHTVSSNFAFCVLVASSPL